MTTTNSKVKAILSNLVATCRDGENGYRSAAEDVDSAELKELLGSYMQQRNQFAAELLNEVHRLDTPAEQRGTVAALIHRGWMNMKAALTRRDAGAVVAECARGEHAATKDYEQALKHDLPPEIRTLVEKQYAKIKEAYERVGGLKLITVLHHLVAACKDGAAGYRAARQHVRDKELQEFFEATAQQREQFAAELQAEDLRLGDHKEQKGTLTGMAHRGWLGMKSFVKGDKADTVLAECARGDHATIKHYEDALSHELPAALRAIVEKQCGKIKETHEHIHTLQGGAVKV